MKKGDGIFINSNVLHRLTQISKTDCHIINFVLSPEFIGGRKDSTIYSKYVIPICSNPALSAIKFSPSIEYEQEIIKNIELAFECYAKAKFGYEMSVRMYLTYSWQIICSNKSNLLKTSIHATEDQRRILKSFNTFMKTILKKLVFL